MTSGEIRLNTLQHVDRIAGAIFRGDLVAEGRRRGGVLFPGDQLEHSYREGIGSRAP